MPIRLRSVTPAIVVLILALCTTVLAALTVRRDVTSLERREFLLEAATIKDALADAMRSYEFALRAGAGLFRSSGDVSSAQWRTFVASLDLAREFPGIQGLGFTAAVAPHELDAFEADQRSKGNFQFSITPDGVRDFYTAIVLLEPQDSRNQRAIGFDMYSEPVRREAMERARTTGDAALSGKVTLVQEIDQGVQPGALMYVPVYAKSDEVTAQGAGAERLRGFTYAAFRIGDLVNSVLRARVPQLVTAFRFELFDGVDPSPGALLFSNAFKQRDMRLEAAFPLRIGGRSWTVRVAGQGPVHKAIDHSKTALVMIGGSIISILIAAITAFQARARDELANSRQALALEVAERKKAQESAEMANQELIHRVKNTLAVVSAIASQTIRYSATLEDFARAFRERLSSLARVQDLLKPQSQFEPDLPLLIKQVLEPYTAGSAEKLRVDGPAVPIPRNDVVLISLTLNELATNATKYGAWSVPHGVVEIVWMTGAGRDGGPEQLVITWRESGGPPAIEPSKKGFGSAVMQFAIKRALSGTIETHYREEGICYVITLPRTFAATGGMAS